MLGNELPPEALRRAAHSALWTFPTILLSSFVVAWGAECAQFYISQGLALALLAWIQVLPEFAVEAVIAWHQDVPLMTANFTGALRLLTGLGWPVIWIFFAAARRARGEPGFFARIELEEEHAVEIVTAQGFQQVRQPVVARGRAAENASPIRFVEPGERARQRVIRPFLVSWPELGVDRKDDLEHISP